MNSPFVHFLIYVPNDPSTLLMPDIELRIKDGHFPSEASSLLHQIVWPYENPNEYFLLDFEELRKANINFVRYVRPSICPHAPTQFPLGGFS